MPTLRTEYFRAGSSPQPEDIILYLSNDGSCSSDALAYDLSSSGKSPTLLLFAALQFIESKHFRKVFDEYVVFDTETTDKDTTACEVIELAGVRVRQGKIVDKFETLIRCDRPISAGATNVHGYVDRDLVGQPSLKEIWPSFRKFIGNSVLVAHNGHQFDVPLLERLTLPWDGLKDVSFFDSLPLARHLFRTGGMRLEDLATRFGVETGRSHHALDDCICLAKVFEYLQEERLRRARVTCLANLLDVAALALAVEGLKELGELADMILKKGAWRLFGRSSATLAEYEQEAFANELVCPPLAEIIDRLGGEDFQDRVRKDRSPEDRFPEIYSRIRDLLESSKADTLVESVRSFLDQLALSRSDGARMDADRVCLLTFHATKGLEFSRVYVVGVEDYQLPGYYEITENREVEIHEARRLLYVAMTRAKDRLTLTYCQQRNGKPSGGTMFLLEMGLVQLNKLIPSTFGD
jgi:DNA polymerase III epsilon subunit family exonuclease